MARHVGFFVNVRMEEKKVTREMEQQIKEESKGHAPRRPTCQSPKDGAGHLLEPIMGLPMTLVCYSCGKMVSLTLPSVVEDKTEVNALKERCNTLELNMTKLTTSITKLTTELDETDKMLNKAIDKLNLVSQLTVSNTVGQHSILGDVIGLGYYSRRRCRC